MRIERLKSAQERLARELVLEDRIEKLEYVAGFDQAAKGEIMICAGVVCCWDSMKTKEIVYTKGHARIPYIPGYLAFREGFVILKAYKKLKTKPDVILIDGNGILHPRKLGLASWVGLKAARPTIGVAKSLLCGEIKGKRIYVDGEVRGFFLKEKRLYISPGHMISLETAVKIVKMCIKNRLPEPIRLADRYAKDTIRRC